MIGVVAQRVLVLNHDRQEIEGTQYGSREQVLTRS